MMDFYSSWLISKFISAWDTNFSILFNLILASITILLCFFFLFLVIFNKFFIIPVLKENTRLKLALAIPTETSITLVKKWQIFLHLLQMKQLKLVKIIKSSNVFSEFFTHCLSFLNFRIKIVSDFIDFI